jgi:hypothetical protein
MEDRSTLKLGFILLPSPFTETKRREMQQEIIGTFAQAIRTKKGIYIYLFNSETEEKSKYDV